MRFVSTILILISCLNLQAQFSYLNNISLKDQSGKSIPSPWTGGFDNPQFQTMHLNDDNFIDLVIFDKGNTVSVKPYINLGITDSIAYTYAPEYISVFPKFGNWGVLIDYNCDGKKDLFTHRTAGIQVYKNVSVTDTLAFKKVSDMLYTGNNVNLYSSASLIPSFVDIDKDGDIDVFTFGVGDKQIEFHKNLSIETYQSCDSFIFIRETDCYGSIEDSENNNEVGFNDCGFRSALEQNQIQHVNNLLYMSDFDDDNDIDIIMGNHLINQVIYLENKGTVAEALFDTFLAPYPINTKVIDIPNFPNVFHLDLDNNGHEELVAAPNTLSSSDNSQGIWLYSSHPSTPDAFSFQQTGLFQDQMFDLGSYSAPHFVDLDQDGLTDILVGNFYHYIYTDTSKTTGVKQKALAFLKNTGTANNPAFKIIDTALINLDTLNVFNANLTSGDLDGDNKLDLIIGNNYGTISHYEATTSGGTNFDLIELNYLDKDFGSDAKPTLADTDKDGDLDLIIGKSDGKLSFIENIGNTTNPNFDAINLIDTFGNVGANRKYGFRDAAPRYFSNGDTNYLFVGSENGYIYQYYHMNDEFILFDSINTGANSTTLDVFDINNDGELEYILGELSGGLRWMQPNAHYFYTNSEVVNELSFKLYPNPAENSFSVSNNNFDRLNIINVNGQIIKSYLPQRSYKINDLPKGIYIIQIQMKNKNNFKRLLKL